jgi:hypothetical protein
MDRRPSVPARCLPYRTRFWSPANVTNTIGECIWLSSRSLLTEDRRTKDPNLLAYHPVKVVLGSGAKAGFEYAKALMGDNTMDFIDLYIMWLYYIREQSREELALLYLYKQKDQQTGFDVVYNIGSKSIYSAINFEHALCKIYLVIKMQLPENNQSVQPNSASNSTHPLLVGKLDTDPGVVVWGRICPFVCAAMNVIARAYDSLSADNRIHVPSFVAEIQGGNDTIPTSYPSDKFGVPFTQSTAMECLKAERMLLVARKAKRVQGSKRLHELVEDIDNDDDDDDNDNDDDCRVYKKKC